MVDFGIVSRYLDDNGRHIKQESTDIFKGSMIYASKHLFSFQKSSRRDDLISLVYCLIFTLEPKKMSLFSNIDYTNKLNRLRLIGEAKKKLGIKDLCGTSERESLTYFLTPFAKEVFNLKFDE